MVTKHLQVPYSVYFTKTSYDSTAPGRRQEESYDFYQFSYIVRCPMRFSHYLKFHGARTAFCRVIEDTMTSAGHRLHTSDGHWTILVWNSNRTILTAAGHRTMWEKSKNLYTNRPMPVRPPADVFYESNCHRW